MKKILLLISLFVAGLNAIKAEVTYTLENGVLTITGTGDMIMPDYGDGNGAPWSNQREEIKEIVMKDGVTNIGNCAFYGCSNLTSIEIPTSVKSIGVMAFGECTSITSITIPNSVENIGMFAFWECSNLKWAVIPKSVTYIDFNAFYECTNLSMVFFHVNKDLKSGGQPFYLCEKLKAIIFIGETLPDDFKNWYLDPNNVYVAIPQHLKDKYIATTTWEDFEATKHLKGYLYLTDNIEYTETIETGLWGCYTRDFKNTEWQALYLPFSLDYEDWKYDFEIAYINGIRQYDTEGDDGKIDETWLDVIKIKKGKTRTNYPYVIRAKKTGQASLIGNNSVTASDISIACSTTTDRYTFTGTYKNVDGSIMEANGYYAMGNGELIQSDGNSTLKPYRWYMEITRIKKQYDWNLAKSIKINLIEDEESVATGVMELHAPKNTDNSVYDLNGRKMNEDNLKPGLYIKNGKKVVIK